MEIQFWSKSYILVFVGFFLCNFWKQIFLHQARNVKSLITTQIHNKKHTQEKRQQQQLEYKFWTET